MQNHSKDNHPNMDLEKEACSVPRWIQLSATLDNMDFNQFVSAYKEDVKGALLDVRTEQEYQSGSIENAINISYLSSNLADQLDGLCKSYVYYVFCRSGRRSIRVCVLMRNMGHTVFNLNGGLSTIPK